MIFRRLWKNGSGPRIESVRRPDGAVRHIGLPYRAEDVDDDGRNALRA